MAGPSDARHKAWVEVSAGKAVAAMKDVTNLIFVDVDAWLKPQNLGLILH